MKARNNLASYVPLVLSLIVVLAGNAVGQLKVLYRFHGPDGYAPKSSLILDAAGNLYGTTLGGTSGSGNAFELSKDAGGLWTETVLYDFDSGSIGYAPQSRVVLGSPVAGSRLRQPMYSCAPGLGAWKAR